jgi:hypothetical protein
MLPATYTIEKGRARLELPQISASIIYEIISDLKRFPLQSRGRRNFRDIPEHRWRRRHGQFRHPALHVAL